jgi:putative hydrolase of the HAD superfamily
MQITYILSDIGGVLGTNGWDHKSRQLAIKQFDLDESLFQDSHDALAAGLDKGTLDIPEYVTAVLEPQKKSISADQFVTFMKEQSQPNQETIEVFSELAKQNRYFLATLNNESLLLNGYRIEKFGLKSIFRSFFSSCYLGSRKPDPEIYDKVLGILQIEPQKCLFIDDRLENLEYAGRRGMNVICFQDVAGLRMDLTKFGIASRAQPA